jgi:hypothetical protein
MQNTSTQIVTTETKGSWLRRLTVFLLVLLILEFIRPASAILTEKYGVPYNCC